MRKFLALNSQSIAGCDEAGRGCLAGPVVAAAVVLTSSFYKTSLVYKMRDSKTLSAAKREQLATALKNAAHLPSPLLHYAVTALSADAIDRLNIRQASLRVLARACTRLTPSPHLIVVDGKDSLEKHITIPSCALIRGDSFHPAIAAASILAKVARDAWMCRAAHTYPGYGFEIHKGYGTQAHRDALKRLGCCLLHRKTFAGVCNTAA